MTFTSGMGRNHFRGQFGGRSPPFLLAALCVGLCILAVSYWRLGVQYKDLEEQLKHLLQKKDSLEANESFISKQLEQREETFSKAKVELQKKEQEVADLKQRLDHEDTELNDIRTSLDSLKKTNEKLKSDLTTKESEFDKLKAKKKELEDENSKLKSEVKELQSHLAEEKNPNSAALVNQSIQSAMMNNGDVSIKVENKPPVQSETNGGDHLVAPNIQVESKLAAKANEVALAKDNLDNNNEDDEEAAKKDTAVDVSQFDPNLSENTV